MFGINSTQKTTHSSRQLQLHHTYNHNYSSIRQQNTATMPAYTDKTTIHELVADYKERINGKVILTTGVTPGGLGATFVEGIAKANPSLLILAGRSASKVEATAKAIAELNPNVKTKTLIVDLGSMKSVRNAAQEVNSWADVPKIDVLVNNAAIMATEFQLTEDGFESQFATCHLGHFLFTNLIIKKLLAAEAPRVVNVSSSGHRASHIRFADPHFSVSFRSLKTTSSRSCANRRQNGETYEKWVAYGQAKTANMLFSISLAEKLEKRGLRSYSLHPGVIMGTGLAGHLNAAEEGDFSVLSK